MLSKVFGWFKEVFAFNVRSRILYDVNNRDEKLREYIGDGIHVKEVPTPIRGKIRIKRKYNEFRRI